MYLIITDSTVHHEGDQRSRDFPGHGYGAYSETVQRVEKFEDYDKFVSQVEYYTRGKDKFTAYEATPFKVSSKIVIEIGK
jgi:hypothetical protein